MALRAVGSNPISHPIDDNKSKQLIIFEKQLLPMRPWLNWIEYRTSDPTVIGSNPIGRTTFDASIAQLDRATAF